MHSIHFSRIENKRPYLEREVKSIIAQGERLVKAMDEPRLGWGAFSYLKLDFCAVQCITVQSQGGIPP